MINSEIYRTLGLTVLIESNEIRSMLIVLIVIIVIQITLPQDNIYDVFLFFRYYSKD